MEDRYPFIRFVIDAGQVIAGAVAVICLLGGTLSACSHGGFGGFVSFVIAIVVAGAVYVAVMIQVELLRVFLDIESTTRQLLAASRQPGQSASPNAGA
jgi:flagellar motor component MotA